MTLTLLFDEALYRPILNFLVILQNVLPGHDFGLSIIVLTVLFRLLLWPLATQSIKSQKTLQAIQPELNALKEKYKDDKVKQSQAMMDLYKAKNINPAAGCLPVLIQLPILFALFYTFRDGLGATEIVAKSLYSFVHLSENVNFIFLGFFNLAEKGITFVYNQDGSFKTVSIVAGGVFLAVIAGVLQFWQTKMITPPKAANKPEKSTADDFSSMMNTQMLYVMPVITIFVASSFPAGLALYWITSTGFSIVQQHFVMKNKAAGGK